VSLDDLHKRFAFFYIIGSVAGSLAGILAYGLMQMDGLGNKAGWRWIFIIEGLVSTVRSSVHLYPVNQSTGHRRGRSSRLRLFARIP
jgi:MFS family permease